MNLFYAIKKGSSRLITLDEIGEMMKGRHKTNPDVPRTELFLGVCHDLAEANNCSVVFIFESMYDLENCVGKFGLTAKFVKRR